MPLWYFAHIVYQKCDFTLNFVIAIFDTIQMFLFVYSDKLYSLLTLPLPFF